MLGSRTAQLPRGRGDSTDGADYCLEREYEDVAAVMRDAGEGALLMGHSYGGLVAAGAARLLELPRLALYEPAMGGVLATVPRELRAELAHRFDGQALAALTAPTLLLVGTESPDWAVRSVSAYLEAIPGAERRVLRGQGHSANMTAPSLLAGELECFFGD